jgi:hypothetical protein
MNAQLSKAVNFLKNHLLGTIVVGIFCSLAASYIYGWFQPQPVPVIKPQPFVAQQTGNNNTQIGSVQGNVTINGTPILERNHPKNSSDAARVELRELGVSWNAESFVSAITDSDLRGVTLFLDGGMDPSLNYKGASAILYSLQPAANKRTEILGLLLKHGFNPNKNLIDTRIMRSYGNLFPPQFIHELTPEGYDAWNKTFAGPADFWIVIRASLAGPAQGDFDLLQLLANSGATFKISLAYLKAYETILDDTPVYWDVRNQIETLTKIKITQRPHKK